MGYDETFRFFPRPPRIDPDAYIAPSAEILGAVEIGPQASIWHQCVLRGDINRIVIGPGSNVQDGTVIHVANDFPAILGSHVSVGHRAIIHACTLADEVLVGMGSILMDGVEVGEQCIIGAGSLVTMNTKIPPGSLVLGSPARVIRPLTREELSQPKTLAKKYIALSNAHRSAPEIGRK